MESKTKDCTKSPEIVGGGDRPVVSVFDIGGGQVRVVNCKAGAKFCGVSSQSFGRVIRRARLARTKPRGSNKRVVWAVREKYPEFFEGLEDD